MEDDIKELLRLRLSHLQNINLNGTYLSNTFMFLFGLDASKIEHEQSNCKSIKINDENDILKLCEELEIHRKNAFNAKVSEFATKHKYPFYLKICFTQKSPFTSNYISRF